MRAALERILEGHMPYPAVVIEPGGDLVSANRAFSLLTADADPALLRAPVNVARLLLDPRGLAPRIANLPEWSAHVLEGVRQAAASYPDPRLAARVAELERLVPQAGATAAGDFAGFAVPLRLVTPRGEMQLLTTLTHFGTTLDVTLAELRLEAFLPGDERTAELPAEAVAQTRR